MSARGKDVYKTEPQSFTLPPHCPSSSTFPCTGKLSARVAELEAEVAERDARIADILSEGEALSRKQSTFEEKLKALRGQLKAMQADRDARREEVVAGASALLGAATARPCVAPPSCASPSLPRSRGASDAHGGARGRDGG